MGVKIRGNVCKCAFVESRKFDKKEVSLRDLLC